MATLLERIHSNVKFFFCLSSNVSIQDKDGYICISFYEFIVCTLMTIIDEPMFKILERITIKIDVLILPFGLKLADHITVNISFCL